MLEPVGPPRSFRLSAKIVEGIRTRAKARVWPTMAAEQRTGKRDPVLIGK
jgi:hypothetical protein